MTPKRRYLSYLRERWWVVMVCIAVAVAGVTAFQTVQRETYDSYAQLYLTLGPQLGSSLFGEEKDDYATQIELLKGSRLQREAMENLGPGADQLKTPIRIEVVRPMGTSILQLRATGSDPALTQRFLQALIDRYLAFKRTTRLSTTGDLVASLTEQLSKIEKELQADQSTWADFERSNNLILLEEEGKGAGMFLADQNVQLANLKLEEELLQRGLAPAVPAWSTNTAGTNAAAGTRKSDDGSSDFAALATTDTTLKAVRVELMLKEAQLSQLLTNGPQYLVKPTQDQVDQIKQNVAALEAVDATQRKAELHELEERIAAISNAIPDWEEKLATSNDRLSAGEQLRAEIQRQQGYYEHLLALLQNVDLTKDMQQERVTVLEPPSPAQPAQRSLTFLVFLAVILGLCGSLGIVFVWHLFDDRFVSVRDVKDQFGETVLGLVPQIKVLRTEPKTVLLQEADPRRAYWESYRHLRSALLLSELGDRRPQTILFTGAMPGEGKTTVALNLARMLARSGLRTVLMDADPHGGGIHHLMGKDEHPGLLDYLRGEAGAGTIVEATDIAGLNFISAGTHREHAEGLLLRPQLSALLTELRKNHEYVILDGAPILAADDAALLVPHADAVVLVMRPFFSRSRMVRQALEMLYQRQARRIAIIFNQARPDDLAGQHYPYRNGSAKTVKTAAAQSR